MINLNAYQIAAAFPIESREYIPRTIPVLKKLLRDEVDKYVSMGTIPQSLEGKMLYACCVLSFIPRHLTDHLAVYEKVLKVLADKEVDDSAALMKKIEIAKTVCIQDLYQFKRRHETVNRIHASCPFHGEDKHPSFVVYKDSNSFHCFTCKVSGDSIDFYMMLNKCDFGEALKVLK